MKTHEEKFLIVLVRTQPRAMALLYPYNGISRQPGIVLLIGFRRYLTPTFSSLLRLILKQSLTVVQSGGIIGKIFAGR